MIRKLRWKFILTNMICVFLMLLLTFGLILSMTGKNLVEEGFYALQDAYMPEKSPQEKQPHPDSKKEETETSTEKTEPSTQETEPAATEKKEPKSEKKDSKGEKKTNKSHHIPIFQLRYDAQGSLISSGSDVFDLSDPVYLTEILNAAIAEGKDYGLLWSEGLSYMRVEREGPDLYVFGDIFTEKNTMEQLLLDCLLIGSICLLGFFLISLLLSRWAVNPTQRAWDKQKQFVADASHELKTPLTVIGTNVEMLQSGELTQEQQERCTENIAVMSRQMRTLTEELLTLARTDDSNNEYHTELLELSGLIEDMSMSFETLFFEQGLTLETTVPTEPAQCKGNPAHLRQLTEILLDNAQKYSLPGEVRMELLRQHGNAILTVSNPAEPISEEMLHRLFDRFYRADPVRTSSSGYGLGLSIARNIVSRHGGQISAAYADGRITFRIRLPLV